MGKAIDEETGLGVEASPRPKALADRIAMLYSAEAMSEVESLRDWFGRRLRNVALAAAKREGRSTVTEDDIWSAFQAFQPGDIDLDGEDADGE